VDLNNYYNFYINFIIKFQKIEILFSYIEKALPNKQAKAEPSESKKKMSSIESIQKENAELRKIVENNAEEIKRCQSVIFQLVGGLFNQKTQKWIGNSHTNVLLGKKYDPETDEPEEDEEYDNCSIWPTTRQGDAHEERIDEHEERIRKLEETIRKLEERVVSFEKKML